MSHPVLDAARKTVSELSSQISELRSSERACVSQINSLGPQEPPRGSADPDGISKRIKALDEKRKEYQQKRRELQEQLSIARGLLSRGEKVVRAAAKAKAERVESLAKASAKGEVK